MSIEYRFAELQSGQRRSLDGQAFGSRQLTGVLMRYGDVAKGPHELREKFEPGSFGNISQADLILNVSHQRDRPLCRSNGGGLKLVDSQAMLTVSAQLPKTQEADDVLTLVRAGVLRGLSIEFNAIQERFENGVRIISKADLVDLGIVDRPAYVDSVVEARRLEVRKALPGRERLATLRGSIESSKRLDCRCSPKDCDEAIFEEESMDDIIELSQPRRRPGQPLGVEPEPTPGPTLFEPPPAPRPGVVEPPPKPQPMKKREVLAVEGEYSRPLGSTSEGSVRVWSDKKGGVQLAIDVPNTDAGRKILDSASTVNIFARPILNLDRSVFAIKNRVAKYRKAWIRGFTLGPSDSALGWRPLYIQVDEEDDAPDRPEPRQEARHWEERRRCL